MRSFYKIFLLAFVLAIFLTQTPTTFAAREISDPELALLYGGGWWGCDTDCNDISGGCPSEVSVYYGCLGCHDLESDGSDCVGSCKTLSNQECQNPQWQLIYITCVDDTVDCEAKWNTFSGWCSFGICNNAPESSGAQCSDCTRDDCPDGS